MYNVDKHFKCNVWSFKGGLWGEAVTYIRPQQPVEFSFKFRSASWSGEFIYTFYTCYSSDWRMREYSLSNITDIMFKNSSAGEQVTDNNVLWALYKKMKKKITTWKYLLIFLVLLSCFPLKCLNILKVTFNKNRSEK